jgi:Fe-S cluster assembly iron-binding protein IscA
VIVIDILNEDVVFRHDSFNLWETKIMSFLNDATLDYVSLSERGMAVLGLST